jgi:DNA-binding XRE family transcriptional regulator
MTPEEFTERRKAIEEEAAKGATRVEARRDQGIAELYLESEWTQREIAKAEGIAQQRVDQLLRFGRFLTYVTTGCSQAVPKNLTERRFRGYWEQTPKETGETPRFKTCIQIMRDDVVIRRERKIYSKELIEKFGDWEWHTAKEIADAFFADPRQIPDKMSVLKRGAVEGARVESRPSGDGPQYRLKAVEWVIRNQFARRNLSPVQRAELALRLEEHVAARAKANEKAGGGSGPSGRQKSDNPVDTKKELAQIAGVSHDTIHKTKVVLAKADDETKAKLRRGCSSAKLLFSSHSSLARASQKAR